MCMRINIDKFIVCILVLATGLVVENATALHSQSPEANQPNEYNRIAQLSASVIQNAPTNSKERNDTINGKVTDSRTGEPLPGVNIILQGTSTGTSTNGEGEFSLNVEHLDVTLIVSYIGYEQKSIEVANRANLEIVLESSIIAGDELVVVGYGVQQRSDITGSVSSIDRKSIVELPVYSIDNALQGRAAGVEISANGFRPGESSTIRIRGTRSFVASNDPLIVLDGVPMDGGLIDLNPRDVESIEILKDASATAIYGSRGANGVILVTTQRGRDGLFIDYNGYVGIQNTGDRIDVMDTQTFAEFVRDSHRINGSYTSDEDIFASWQLDAIQNNRTTDWQDLVLNNGIQQNHSISIRGASANTNYAISTSFDDHDAIVTNNDFRRYSFRLNLDQDISSRIRVGLSSTLNNSTQHQSGGLARVLTNFPMASPHGQNGNIRMFDERGDRNPLFDMQRENMLDKRNRTRLIGTIYAEAAVIPERLRFRANFSPDLTFREDGFYQRDLESRAGIFDSREASTLFEAQIDWQEEFLGFHRLNVTSLYSIQNYNGTMTRLEVSGLPYENQLYHNLGSADRIDHRSSSLSEWTLESYMLRANYAYDNRYLLTLTGRVDGSSRLASGNEYGLFPSLALAWNVTNEPFMRNFDLLSSLRLRFSIGEVGNTAIQPYQTQGALNPLEVAFDSENIFVFEHGDIANPDLRWERTRTMDLGLDFSLLENRIDGSIDIYQSNTKDLLLFRQLPATSGYTSTLENIGEVRNRGFEFSLSSVNVQTPRFVWSMDFNFSTNRNQILELFGDGRDDPGSGWFIGESMNANYYWDRIGIWQLDEADVAASYGFEPGEIKFRDVTGDGRIGGNDRVILGTTDPKWTAGLSNRLSYRNFDFSIFVYTAQGARSSGEDSHFASATFDGLLSFRPQHGNNLNLPYWTPENPSNTWPKPRMEAEPYRGAFAYGMDMSFFRIRNITLGYSVSDNILSPLGMKNARIYASVQNPLTITNFIGFDPEGASGRAQMPNYQTYLLGIELGF